MTSAQRHAEASLASVFAADSPEKHALAVELLLCDLADCARDAASVVRSAWQEAAPGRPWDRHAKMLERAALAFQRWRR